MDISFTGIPQFTLLMWGHKKNMESENRINRGYLVHSTKEEENTIEL